MGLLDKFFSPDRRKAHEEEILDHLVDLLNTKEGFGSWQKNFGLQHYSYCKSREQIIEQIKKDIKKNIEYFEKRIAIATITHIEKADQLSLSFLIDCQLNKKKRSLSIVLDNQKNQVRLEVES
jgi:predicted component of type VI protein secretion system